MFASAEQVDLEKYSPVCVEPPADQTGFTASGQVIGEQLSNKQGYSGTCKIIGRLAVFFSVHQCPSVFFSILQYFQ